MCLRRKYHLRHLSRWLGKSRSVYDIRCVHRDIMACRTRHRVVKAAKFGTSVLFGVL
jgi:hypothetical protein